jgi:arsenite-transporting ATPase
VLTPEKLPILETKKAFHLLERNHVPVAAIVVNRLLPHDVGGEFLETRRRQEKRYLQEIERSFATAPRMNLPLLPYDPLGLEALRRVGRLLLKQEELAENHP